MSDVELTISVGQKQPGALRLVATLVIAASLSGLALSTAYQVTKPVIDANNARELEAAVFKVVPGSSQLQKLVWRDARLVPEPRDDTSAGDVVYGAYDDQGRFLGYAIEHGGSGFQDIIRVLYGFDAQQNRVIGMEVLESRETPGLGDKIWKDEAFVSNFAALSIDSPIVVVKDGRDADNEVDAITGATISSKAVVGIINESHARWHERLAGAEPPALPPAAAEGE